MAESLLRRLLYGFLLLFTVVILNFLLLQAAPGDVVDAIVADTGGASEEVVARIRAEYGLDQPVYQQLLSYLQKMLAGDLGYSFHYDRPVLSLIVNHLPATIMLSLSAIIIAVIVGTLLGTVSALNPKGIVSHIVTVLSLLGYATPVFWLGMMALILFAYEFPIFPVFGLRSVPAPETLPGQVIDIIYHMILPSLTLSILFIASYSRISRAAMLDVMGSDYIRTARAKGLPEWVVVFKHGLKNAGLPIVTIAGLQLSHAFSGAVLVETIFSLPGIGPLLLESVTGRDYPVMLGILQGSALMVIAANIITDMIYRVLDPRIRGTV